MEIYFDTNPVTVANFIQNIKEGLYTNKEFYKIIDFSNSRIIYSGINPNNFSKELDVNTERRDGFIPLEISLIEDSSPKYSLPIHDPLKLSSLINRFEPGTIAMVSVNETTSSSTEFFFTTNYMAELDGRYSIFGRVISGLEILKKIDKTDKIIKIDIF